MSFRLSAARACLHSACCSSACPASPESSTRARQSSTFSGLRVSLRSRRRPKRFGRMWSRSPNCPRLLNPSLKLGLRIHFARKYPAAVLERKGTASFQPELLSSRSRFGKSRHFFASTWAQEPPPMLELSPFKIHPRHLDHYFAAQHGEFRLTA